MTNIEAQKKLVEWGVLDPPADGKWGNWSKSALSEIQKLLKSSVTDGILNETSIALLEKLGSPPEIKASGWLEKVIRYYEKKNYWIARGTNVFNIVYVEGMYPDGTPNIDRLDEWNDTRALFQVEHNGSARLVDTWAATSEPGAYYTYHRMSPGGAARIAFGQYWAWSVGMHGSRNPYEALVQCADVEFYRDDNEDGFRKGDEVTNANIGANQHHGFSMPEVGKNSAGCLVGQSITGHKQFMLYNKSDRRYVTNNSYKYATAVLPADELGLNS
ncbi:MAG: peptidoglycan-binding protein [Brasilonema angustatum HA4187-MV1]|jgi:hypothetical protein|nr:peptidoglycan-binding protein [Brasilonema angustatum HA4187-MV1]